MSKQRVHISKDSAVLILWDISVQDMEISDKLVCLCDRHVDVWNLSNYFKIL